MSDLVQNIIAALIIGLIIAVMAVIKNIQIKALVYSLPIPITAALIATGGNVNANHLIGLFLSNLFLWCVYLLNRSKLGIFLSDLLAAAAYLIAGYGLIQLIDITFYWVLLIYFAAWLVFLLCWKSQNDEEISADASKINPGSKFAIVSFFAFALLNLKNLLSGIIVTFPFSGVFAVIESRYMLETLAFTFTRNSVAIAAMFAVLYTLSDVNLWIKISVSWAVYFAVLKIVSALFPIGKSKIQTADNVRLNEKVKPAIDELKQV